MKKTIKIGLLILCTSVLLMSCADSVEVQKCISTEEAGFWYGLWHGWIFVISFIWSLFDDSVSVYAVYNNGGWYDFGFLLGLGSALGGSTTVYKSRK